VPASGLHLIAQAHAQVFMYISISIPPSWCIVDIDSMAFFMQYWVDYWLGNFLDEYVLSAVTRFRSLLTCQADEPEPIHEKTLRLKTWSLCCYALPAMIN
jgi:hypothetical protein